MQNSLSFRKLFRIKDGTFDNINFTLWFDDFFLIHIEFNNSNTILIAGFVPNEAKMKYGLSLNRHYLTIIGSHAVFDDINAVDIYNLIEVV